MISPHGVPIDLLDRFIIQILCFKFNFLFRLLIIRTTSYNLADIIKIVAIRA
jgi:DNA helicase TIP49 (TBP-interacting protein)